MMGREFYRSLIALIACAVLSPALQAEVVIGDFESGSLDGWQPWASEVTLVPSNLDSDLHATRGTYALNVQIDLGELYVNGPWLSEVDLPGFRQLFIANPIVAADISWKTSEWSSDPDGLWSRWFAPVLNIQGEFYTLDDSMYYDPVFPEFPGYWQQYLFGEEHRRTIYWDFSEFVANNEAEILASTYFELLLNLGMDPAFDTAGGSMWIDNIRLIPEPASGTLLVMAMGCLLASRRRS